MAPSPAGTASCIALARSSTSGTASFNASTPAATSAAVFAEAMASDHGRLRPAFLLPQAIDGDTRRQHQGLGIDGLVQRFGRAFGDQLPEVAAQARRRLRRRSRE